MKDDTISRQAAIDALLLDPGSEEWQLEAIENLPSAQPGQRNARVFQGIIVEYPSINVYPEYEGKPYFSIKYTVNEQKFIGYGTYNPEVLSEYLKEYFMPPTLPGCEDVVPRTSIEYICRKNTVSTNPYEHKYHDKFIQFMDDPEISDFGRWQHSNGFNTALVAVKCDLDKVPFVMSKAAQQTALTADDIETIRIHLSAFKETLCNQGRWTEAAEYERLIQRLTGKR